MGEITSPEHEGVQIPQQQQRLESKVTARPPVNICRVNPQRRVEAVIHTTILGQPPLSSPRTFSDAAGFETLLDGDASAPPTDAPGNLDEVSKRSDHKTRPSNQPRVRPDDCAVKLGQGGPLVLPTSGKTEPRPRRRKGK